MRCFCVVIILKPHYLYVNVNMFSASLMLADMDYIAPSQACIKPAMTKAAQATSSGTVYRHGDADAPPPEILKISLQDCLACSGCVTSAETMLVTNQSKEELLTTLSATEKHVVVTISEQSAASIAVQLGSTVQAAYDVIARFARSVIRAEYVLGLEWAQHAALQLTAAEYLQRVATAPETLPMIVSSCPGWVCYCEKQYPELLPHLSRVMSPQGIAGSLLKRVIGGGNTTSSLESVYHVSIQPCFDRKLEAARDGEAAVSEEEAVGVRYTDCVLSSHEVLEWMTEIAAAASSTPVMQWGPESTVHGLDAAPTIERRDDNARPTVPADDNEEGRKDSDELTALQGSGGYHQHVLTAAAQQCVGRGAFSWSTATFETKRNANHRLIRTPVDAQLSLPQPLPSNGAKQHLFCIAYGFQHIQNIVRGLRKRLSTTPLYTFIELMACPSGCLNGGGQVRTSSHEETLTSVRRVFVEHRAGGLCGPPHDSTATNDEEDHSTESPIAKVPRTERTSSHQIEGILSGALLHNDAVAMTFVTTQFHDRKKEMEEILKANPMHSLKW
ncbi:iron-containing hydrogenase, putative [Bodo saltans]|uniref:Iron-containing hydrogenase, putative n=1 Tax=Bodo saltans TaxID=75058 RepID=A0A0S4J2N1_BODSA|nr:iron-containing hydrogenase, putative [Bodo saltans]|eukprot:CUG84583.1 iron-containing hydrogenase, putative [Bodo saltans]